MKKITIIITLVFALASLSKINAQQTSKFKDKRDKKVYKTVKIGTQVWMAQNLAYKPKSGTYWTNDKNAYFYDWNTAKKACPNGWHIPSENEWKKLSNKLGGQFKSGGKLKSKSKLWKSPNTGATNSSKFNAKPYGSYSHYSKKIELRGEYAFFWSSTVNPDFDYDKNDDEEIYMFALDFDAAGLREVSTNRKTGNSVRCIKD